ncbi:aminotransferase class IV [Aegicerativicinus sediminis]
MINVNGRLLQQDAPSIYLDNRGFKYADSVFETLKVVRGKILFWEDHYFRLMSSMRIMRMEIPMTFTMEFLEEEIRKTIETEPNENSVYRVRLVVARTGGGLYSPNTNDIDYYISFASLQNELYSINEDDYEVDLFKDYYVNTGLLSNIKKSDKSLNVLGSIYAKENDFKNCLLLNNDKHLVEALNGNIFLVFGNTIKTPSLDQGVLKGIIRQQLIEIIKKDPNYNLEETSISPFELQRADEVFITNVIIGILPVSRYRKKDFEKVNVNYLLEQLNEKVKNQL